MLVSNVGYSVVDWTPGVILDFLLVLGHNILLEPGI